jgi:hypothetical protein
VQKKVGVFFSNGDIASSFRVYTDNSANSISKIFPIDLTLFLMQVSIHLHGYTKTLSLTRHRHPSAALTGISSTVAEDMRLFFSPAWRHI